MALSEEGGDLIGRLSRALGSRVIELKRIRGGGYTPAGRYVATFGDGRTAFVKVGVSAATDGWLRQEYGIYSRIDAEWLPRFLAFDEQGEHALLVLEDLSDAHWPPPWRPGDVEAVLRIMELVSATPPPPGLPRFADEQEAIMGWTQVADDPEPFLALELCSSEWLKAALPALLDASRAAQLDGDALLHQDVRSDNLCFRDGRALLVDWNWASVGNPLVDVAAWLPSLHAEGGPPPEAILPKGATELAALFSGFWAAQAGLPIIPEAPHVRRVQLSQLRTALPWAARSLGFTIPAVGGQ